MAIKARTTHSPVIRAEDYALNKEIQEVIKGKNMYFSELVWWWRSGQHLPVEPANHKKTQDHASLVFSSPLTASETVYLDLGKKAGALTKKEIENYHKYICVNYLMEKSDEIKRIEQSFKGLTDLIDNLGEGDEIVLTETK